MTPQRQLHSIAPLAALGLALACSPSNAGVGPVSDAVVRNVIIAPDSVTVGLRTALTFTAVAQGVSGIVPGVTFVWSSSNTAVATVNQNGRVTPVDTGRTQITVSAQGISALATVIVMPPAVDSIVVVPQTDTVLFGGQLQLSDTVKDQYGDTLNRPVTWASSNAGVATVSGTGLVVAQGPGTANITASAGGKSGASTIVVPDTTPASISLQVSPDSVVVTPDPLDALIQLTATVRNAAGQVLSNYPVVFTSSDTVVSGTLGDTLVTVVGGSDLIMPDGNGTAIITAVAGHFAAQAPLTVCYAASSPICNPLAGVRLAPAVDTIAVGDSVVMDAIGVDSSGNTYPDMGVAWTAGPVLSSDSSLAIAVAPWGTVYAVNPGTQYVEGGIPGFGGQALITVVPAPATSIAAAAIDLQARGAHTISAIALASARQRAARERQEQAMQQVVLQRMRLARSPSMRAYYTRLAARLATSEERVAGSIMVK
jgi:trimeric autotransporter adhesin